MSAENAPKRFDEQRPSFAMPVNPNEQNLFSAVALRRGRHMGGHGGIRSEDRSFGLGSQETIEWFGAECDLSLLSSWYLNLSAELTRGTAEHADQIYSSLTYRF